MFAFVKRRGFLVLLGFLLLALFIWFAGPYFAFADFRPLDGALARIVLFLVIVGAYVAVRLVRRFLTVRATGQFAAAVVKQEDSAGPSAEAVQLRERFEEAVSALKASERSGRGLYDLPWYVIIGAPGSGKTTALLNSGLTFPLEQRVGKGALRGVGGTRNCDWWFTDEAVFLDTAGRYTTQDSDAGSDRAAWAEFLSLLLKYRKRRPVNGVILTISASDLMSGAALREGHVQAARRRLDELNEQLQIQLPVYVMVTKCDLVSGFAEYFDNLTQETRAQVWGVTFPYEQTLNGQAAALYPGEFDQLMARLNGRVFARVDEDRDVRRRTKLFAFPQQIAALRDALCGFVTDVFASTRHDRQILLRGVYFTSGTQEGTPVDRLLGAIARRYGVAGDAVAPPTGHGKAFFVTRLLKDVMIAESGLAGVNRRLEVKNAALQLGAYAAVALVTVVGLLLFSLSYSRNASYIGEVEREVAKIGTVQRAGPADPVEALLPRLNAIRAAVTVADQHREDTPWSMRWGLYQGNAIGNAARDAYVRELDGTLLPRTAARIEERLGQYASEPEKLFEYLKAYLMLGQPSRLDRKHLQFVASLEWRSADAAAPTADVTLAKHFESLVDYAKTLRPIALNERIVAQARSSIRQASIAQIIYGRLKRAHDADTARSLRLDQLAGVGVETVIRRKSGTSLSEPLSGLYLKTVFQEVTGQQIGALVKQFAADDWVWGEDKGYFSVSGPLTGEVVDLYERDYIATWDTVLDDLELIPFATLQQAADSLGILAGRTSPLKALLAAIADNTTLVEPAKAPTGAVASAQKSITDKLGGLFDKLPAEVKGNTPALPGALVTAHFQPIHKILAGEAGNTPLDQVLVRIGQMQHYLGSLAGDPHATPPDALADPNFREIAQSLREEVATMPPIVQSLASQVGRKAEASVGSSASAELEKRYKAEVLQPCNAVLQDRYPFTVTSTRELPVVDFARLFAEDGLFDKFFTENLQALVDTSQPTWAWKPGFVAGSREMLEKFEAASRIRQMFFRRGSPAPDLRFTVNISGIDPKIPKFALEIDGQYFDAKDPNKIRQATWPGPTPGRSSARMTSRAGVQSQDDALGAWGLFRMFDRHGQRITDTRFVLGFETGGEEVRVTIEADRVDNPLARRDWQRFGCGL